MKLLNKTALITGANKGIGRSVALAFASEGADVILVARNHDMLEAVAAEISSAIGRGRACANLHLLRALLQCLSRSEDPQ